MKSVATSKCGIHLQFTLFKGEKQGELFYKCATFEKRADQQGYRPVQDDEVSARPKWPELSDQAGLRIFLEFYKGQCEMYQLLQNELGQNEFSVSIGTALQDDVCAQKNGAYLKACLDIIKLYLLGLLKSTNASSLVHSLQGGSSMPGLLHHELSNDESPEALTSDGLLFDGEISIRSRSDDESSEPDEQSDSDSMSLLSP